MNRRRTPQQIEREVDRQVRVALGRYAKSDQNPSGGMGLYDPSVSARYVVILDKDAEPHSFKTVRAAVAFARQYARERAGQSDARLVQT